MKTFIPLKLLLLLFVGNGFAQTPLDQLIAEGLKNNLTLQQRTITLAQAQTALKIARNQFLPSVQLMGDYTSGNGGRTIAIPVGDLLNPVYQSLNQLTQSDQFPQIKNVSENFFPKNFYDAKVRTSVPIINSDLVMNRAIKGKQSLLADYDAKLYKRQLIFEITQAYYVHLSAIHAVRIYEGALSIVQRNLEVNESLKRNGKGLPAQVLRSKSELEKVKADWKNATMQATNSRRYLNFLLNRDLDTAIDTSFHFDYQSPDSLSGSASTREELSILAISEDINESLVKMNQLRRLPRINAFLDLGSQARDWRFDNQSRYYLFGVQLAVPLFQGFSANLNIRQSKLELNKSTLALQNAKSALALSAANAKSEFETADQNFRSSLEQLNAAESYFRLIEKGYAEGVNTQIEFLDARNQLTSSQLLSNVSAFNLLIAKAKVERETASITINE